MAVLPHALADSLRPKWLAAQEYPLKLAVVFAAYLLGGKLGLAVPFTSANVSPVWPPSGIALAALLLWGVRMWPGVALGAFAVNFFSAIPHPAALGITAGNTSAAVAGAYLLRRIPGFQDSLGRLRDVLALMVLGALVSPMVAATAGVSSLFLAGANPWSAFGSAWAVWWLGDAMGVLLLAPLILGLRRLRQTLGGRRGLEAALLAAATVLTSMMIFDNRLLFHVADDVLAFAVFPWVIWAAIRFGVGGAAVVSTLTTSISVWATASGSGPFVKHGALGNVALLQLFLAVIAVSGLLLSAVITERESAEDALEREKQLAEALRQSEERFRRAQAAANLGAFDWNIRSGELVWAAEVPALEGMPGQQLEDWIAQVHPEDRERVLAVLKHWEEEGGDYDLEGRLVRAEGSVVWLHTTGHTLYDPQGRPAHVVGIARDITDRKRAEEMLRVSEKLATAGRMAAAIAHEINNPLEAVTNLLYLLENHPGLDPEAQEYTQLAQREMGRVAHIARQTLAFYRESTGPSAVRPAEVLDSVLGFYQQRLALQKVAVERRYDSQQEIQAFAGELRQVFSNLLANALDAVGPEGRILVHVYASRDREASGREGVRVVMADNGPGIEDELQKKIFEPFFTTKGDKGTGLGLWVSQGIVQRHGGSIRVRSCARSGRNGTAFSVFLPLEAAERARSSAAGSGCTA